jgi:DNA polymerase-3 subunit delta'
MLLCGPAGIGKSGFAHALVQRLLCEKMPAGIAFACGECPSCRWVAAGQHPDFRRVIPESDEESEAGGDEGATASEKKKSSQILIEQIRTLSDFIFVGGHRNGARVVLIEPAEAMNAAAANSLLKILEEPPSTVYFILTSSRWRRLLPTIRSRCRMLSFPRPGEVEAKRWLSEQKAGDAAKLLPLLGQAPLLALEEQERGRSAVFADVSASLLDVSADPLALAVRWEAHLKKRDTGLSMDELVAVIQKWVGDVATQGAGGKARFFTANSGQLDTLVRRADPDRVIRFYNELLKIRALANHPLNVRLVLDDLAMRYLRALAPVSP